MQYFAAEIKWFWKRVVKNEKIDGAEKVTSKFLRMKRVIGVDERVSAFNAKLKKARSSYTRLGDNAAQSYASAKNAQNKNL